MFSSILPVLLSLLPITTSSLPTSSSSSPEIAPRAPTALNTTQSYYLRTVSNSSNPLYSDLYLETYHTGAGLNDAVLVPGPVPSPDDNYAAVGFLNGTANSTDPDDVVGFYQEFDLGNDFPYGLDLEIYEPYAAWTPVQVNAGQGSAGFYLDQGKGLVWNETEFGGWLVCAWWHGLPQLFWYEAYYSDPIPDSCNFVYLMPEYI